MFTCGTCGKEFPAGYRARDQHCASTGHRPPKFECDTCDACFGSEHARWQHMRAKGHFADDDDNEADWECSRCSDVFYEEEDCRQHMIECHFYCSDCDREFMNYNNIKQHLNSRTHRGNPISCPFCRIGFTTASGMVHHLEHGSCPRAPRLNRDEIYQLVRSKDPNGIISRQSIPWVASARVSHIATERAWNSWRDCYECYFCHRGFRQLYALNQHLNSPVHQESLYHCFKCRSEFKTLAAVTNHLESETCGAMRFETVQNRICDVVSGNRLLGF
ncbi:hypothetical protein C8A03DRAFT_39632 [Achaetomium macrosporum]|uniref:C2H2-type domain-containing protein n=1 Tax=Achaetomium macrosporum TaxID=79813 RepID=A0AAN7H9D5_9PEZI|nr:hypothetical protein C8A03DRAFT_39632 [Achaetomium macrosporum]